jgi:hypothetical protein
VADDPILESEVDRRVREELDRRQISTLAEGFADLRARVERGNNLKRDIVERLDRGDRQFDRVEHRIDAVAEDLHSLVTELGIDKMSSDQKAALPAMAREWVEESDQAQEHHKQVEHRSQRVATWTPVVNVLLGLLLVLSTLLAFVIHH